MDTSDIVILVIIFTSILALWFTISLQPVTESENTIHNATHIYECPDSAILISSCERLT